MQKVFGKRPAWMPAQTDDAADPRLRIELMGPKQAFYTVGDPVSGKVVLESPVDEGVKEVTIRFRGAANNVVYVKDGAHGTNTHYHGKAVLFEYVELLYQNKYTLAANTRYEWPFAFKFPETTHPPDTAYHWPPHSSFKTSKIQPLPPAYANQYRSGLSGEGYDCTVEYTLCARLMRPGAASAFKRYDTRGYTSIVPLPYLQLPLDAASSLASRQYAERQALEFRSLLLLPENNDRVLTLKEKTRSRFKAGSLPTVAFELAFSTVKRLQLGEDFAVALTLRHQPEQSTAAVPPTIALEALAVSILATTHVRSETRLVAHEDVSTRLIPCDVIQTTPSPTDPPTPVPFTKATDHTLTYRARLPPSPFLVPAFTTYNVNHAYRLRVAGVLACADKKLPVECVHTLVVTPGGALAFASDGGGGGAAAGSAVKPVARAGRRLDLVADDEVLPSYQASQHGGAPAYQQAVPAYEPAEEAGSSAVGAEGAAGVPVVGTEERVYA